MKYIYTPDKEYPVYKDDVLRRLLKKNYLLSKNVSDELLETFGYFVVHDNKTTFVALSGEKIIEIDPAKDDEGKWVKQYQVVKMSSTEMEEAYKSKKDRINRLYQDKLELGYPFVIDGKTEHIQLRKDDISQLNNVLLYLGTKEEDYVGFIRTKENVNRFYSRDELIALIKEALIYNVKIYNAYRIVMDDFMSCSDIDKLKYKIPNSLEVN